ncbi:MAG: sigma-54-dependent Fis family transcriptional regulator [Planctomycetes bacterium]|nr:sigma-54-dependent Fis family transcriptional regulator [Planctomycetota bacterium]
MHKAHILVVDDEKLIRWSLKEYLQQEGFKVSAAEDGKVALQVLSDEPVDLILLDYKLPDTNGLELLQQARCLQPDLPVVMVTSHSSVENAVQAMKAGANDYVAKPFRNEDIGLRVERVLETGRLRKEVQHFRQEQLQRFGFDKMIGKSSQILSVFKLVERVLPLGDATILIQGESGTGKDVLAKAIHYGGPRSSGPYVNITCTALPESLLESELFGHEKGAFTDAKAQKKGLIELAHGGTLFLDEIGDMSLYHQSKLLRFLEEKAFRRVGGQRDITVDLRVIAATNRDLKKLVEKGGFREDLYFRLKVIPILLPPLRERTGDVPLLVQHFIQEYNREFKKSVKGVTPALMKRLEDYHWPGNIRELRNTIERAMILSTQEHLGGEDLPLEILDEPSGKTSSESAVTLTRKGINIEDLERDLVVQALRLTNGNQTQAGRLLGLNRDQIRYRIEKFSLKIKDDGESPVLHEAEHGGSGD